MTRARLFFLVAVATIGGAGAAAGCADEDPRYGPPEAIRDRKINYGNGTTPEPPADTGTPGVPKTARQLFDELFDTFAANPPNGTCKPCHEPAGTAPDTAEFCTPTKDASYAIFKAKNYHVLATLNAFYTKGAHSGGPALTAKQKALTEEWSKAEAGDAGK